MRDRHEPGDAFIARLEARIAGEIARRNAGSGRAWWIATPWRLATAAAILTVVSMTAGGAAVASRYEAQDRERRDLLLESFQRRVALAEERLLLASAELRDVERRVATGLDQPSAPAAARLKVIEAEAELRALRLSVEEIRISSREPLDAVSAPRVGGRDFVGERWRAGLTLPEAALDVERRRLADEQRRVELGLARAGGFEAARARVVEIEVALATLRTRLRIREQFLAGLVSGALAELQVLEAEAEQRRRAAEARLEVERRAVAHLRGRVEIGLAAPIELARAELAVREVELELQKAVVDLALVRKRIAEHRE